MTFYKKNIFAFCIALAILFPSITIADNAKLDSLLQKLKEANIDTIKINILTELAWECKLNNHFEEGLKYSIEALNLSTKIDYKKGIAGSYHILGTIYWKMDNLDKALDSYFRSLKILEEMNDKLRIASIHNNIGIVFRNSGKYEKALENYFVSLKIREENLKRSMDIGDSLKIAEAQRGISPVLCNIGLTFMNLGKYKDALEYYNSSLKIDKTLGDKIGIAANYNNIGIIHFEQRNFKEALDNLFASLKVKEEIGDKNEIIRASNNIGNVLLKQGNTIKAKEIQLSTLNLALEINAKNQLRFIYRSLSECDSALKNWESAYNFNKLFMQFKDSIFNEESSKQMAEMQTKYETEKKEKEITLLNKDNELQQTQLNKQQIIIWFIIVGLLLTGISSFISYRSFLHKKKANILLEAKNKMIEKQRNDILDSINYAKNIQKSMLMREEEVQKILPFDNFILFQPKDIVSGDFYWFSKQEDKFLIAAIDCTGHGVPGGFMSMIGNSLLNEIVLKMRITKPSEILSTLNVLIKDTLRQNTDKAHAQDGMDMALCAIDTKNRILEYAGARNPLYIISSTLTFSETERINFLPMENNPNMGLYAIKADPFSIGGKTPSIMRGKEKTYTNHELPLTPDSTIYLFSDGYIDQHGGADKKKLGSPKFREILLNNYLKNSDGQKVALSSEIESWQGKQKQTDDILVIGMKI